MVKIKDMDAMFNLDDSQGLQDDNQGSHDNNQNLQDNNQVEGTVEPTLEPETAEEAERMETEDLINEMFGLDFNDEENEDNKETNKEESSKEIKEENLQEEEIEGNEEEGDIRQENAGQEEGEEEDITSVVDQLLAEAEALGGEEVDKAAEEVKEAIESGAPEEELLNKISELEQALLEEQFQKEAEQKEKERLLERINELQDKLAEYEMRNYEYGTIEKVMDEDPQLKGFVKILAYYKANPEKIGKERLISALDNFITSEFGVSVKDLLSKQAEQENKKMTMGEEKEPIEINIKTNEDVNPLDEMFNI